jgi:TolB protein
MRKSLASLLALSAVVVAVVSSSAAGGEEAEFANVVGHDLPSWSPDGSHILFVGFRSGRAGDIYTIRPNGKGLRRLTATPEHEDMPRYAPDGSKIAYVRKAGPRSLDFHIFVMNADGSGQTQITQTNPPNYAPSWSPDGSKIAFVSAPGWIFVMNADGSGRTRLSTPPRRDDSPVWSPDGKLILFESTRTEFSQVRLFTMRPDGTDVRELRADDRRVWWNEGTPTWSPDGSKIAFVTAGHPPVGNTEIYVMNADGNGLRRMTKSDIPDDQPAWSPDGRTIAFTRGWSLRPEIHVMPSRGGKARKITGVNLKFVRLLRGEPRAGRYYTVDLIVRPKLDRFADISCLAQIGNSSKGVLAVEFAGIRQGGLRCAWYVPRSAKRKRFHAFVGAAAGGSQVTRGFSARIR